MENPTEEQINAIQEIIDALADFKEDCCVNPEVDITLKRKELYLMFSYLITIPFELRNTEWEIINKTLKQKLNSTK